MRTGLAKKKYIEQHVKHSDIKRDNKQVENKSRIGEKKNIRH